MAERSTIVRDLESIEEKIYYIIKNEGLDILSMYLTEIKWDSLDYTNDMNSVYIPDYLKKHFIENKKEKLEMNVGKSFARYKKELTSNAFSTLYEDYENIITSKLHANIGNINMVFKNYFEKQLVYIKINEIFKVQAFTITSLFKNLLDFMKLSIKEPKKKQKKKQELIKLKEAQFKFKFKKKENENKQEKKEEQQIEKSRKEKIKKPPKKKKKKKELQVKYYKTHGIPLEKPDLTHFKILFPILNGFSMFAYQDKDLIFGELEDYEDDFLTKRLRKFDEKTSTTSDPKIKQARLRQRLKMQQAIDKYYKKKKIFLTSSYARIYLSRMKFVDKKAHKHKKKVIKAIYKYTNENVIRVSERVSPFSFGRK